jgi:hypothetical protein
MYFSIFIKSNQVFFGGDGLDLDGLEVEELSPQQIY